MATVGAGIFSANLWPAFFWEMPSSSSGKRKRNPIFKPLAVSTEQASTAMTVKNNTASTRSSSVEKKSSEDAVKTKRRFINNVEEWEESEGNIKGLKDYFEEAKAMIRSSEAGDSPRWFSPSVCGPHTHDSPFLLYIPGIDGVGLGLIRHHQRLAKIFDVCCLHIPVKDRTSFTGLVKLIERKVRTENYRSPNRPIYLVGESLGACLALAVAARNPDIDLVLILSNPATSFSKSVLQTTTPLLELMPDQITLTLTYMLSLMAGDPLKMAVDNIVKGLSLQPTIQELSHNLAAVSSYLSVLTDILPKETLLWKLELLKAASAYANARLHTVKAETLILCSGRDQLLPSKEEGERLSCALPICQTRCFDDNGHFLLLEDGVDLVTIIKGARYYRSGRNVDWVFDFMPPTTTEFNKLYEDNRLLADLTSPVMLSTLEDGKIVRGLSGIPLEGPVLLVGYHNFLGFEAFTMVPEFKKERNILVRGLAHPMMFCKSKDGGLPDIRPYDRLRMMGAVPASAVNFYKLMSSKSHALLFPGGMREALHRKGEEYKLFWPERSEFVRMAAAFGAKIIPFGAVGEDDIAQIVLDYDDQMKIPFFKSQIEGWTAKLIKLRGDTKGEVANQPVHFPYYIPKVPGRYYFYFGKPIETKGRKQELRDKKKAQELYFQIKCEVEKNISYLKEKREKDAYRNILPRFLYKAAHGFMSQVPTFKI